MPTGVGPGRRLLRPTEQVRTVEIEQCGSRLSVPVSRSEFWEWDMACLTVLGAWMRDVPFEDKDHGPGAYIISTRPTLFADIIYQRQVRSSLAVSSRVLLINTNIKEDSL